MRGDAEGGHLADLPLARSIKVFYLNGVFPVLFVIGNAARALDHHARFLVVQVGIVRIYAYDRHGRAVVDKEGAACRGGAKQIVREGAGADDRGLAHGDGRGIALGGAGGLAAVGGIADLLALRRGDDDVQRRVVEACCGFDDRLLGARGIAVFVVRLARRGGFQVQPGIAAIRQTVGYVAELRAKGQAAGIALRVGQIQLVALGGDFEIGVQRGGLAV